MFVAWPGCGSSRHPQCVAWIDRTEAHRTNETGGGIAAAARSLSSRQLDAVVLERERAVARAGRRRDGVEHGGGPPPEGRRAHATPHPPPRPHDDGVAFSHLPQAPHVGGV